MKTNKANENEHPVCYVLRDWSKARKANTIIAEKTERIPSLSVPSTKQTETKCARQVYFLPH